VETATEVGADDFDVPDAKIRPDGKNGILP
jgi:hypothetical protein